MNAETKNDLFKWTGIVALLAILSKLLGFLRETSIAYAFGAGLETDAYFMAILIPTLVFQTLQTYAVKAFLPIYGSMHQPREKQAFTNTFALLVLLTLGGVLLLIQLFTPQIVTLLAPGFEGEAATLTVKLMRLASAALLFMGLSSIAASYLHAHHLFLGPALIGVPFNLIIIGGALLAGAYFGISGLAVVTVAAYGSKVLIQLPWVLKKGFSLRVGVDWRHPGIRELRKILPPILFAGAAAELKALTDRIFATLLPVGGVSALNYAARVRIMPIALFVTPLATVFYPTLVDLAAAKKFDEFKNTFAQGLGVIIFLYLPISAGFLALGEPIIRLVFERGAFDTEATAVTALMLVVFSIGMVGEAVQQLVVRAFFAIKDFRTPMLVTFGVAGLNLALNAVLINPLQHAGLALATSICFLIGSGLSLYLLRRKIGSLHGKVLLQGFLRSLLAASLMGGALYRGADAWRSAWQPVGFTEQAIQLGALIGGGAALYFGLAWLLKVREMRITLELAGRLRQKLIGKLKSK